MTHRRVRARWALIVGDVALHVVALLWIFWGPVAPIRPSQPAGMTVLSLAAAVPSPAAAVAGSPKPAQPVATPPVAAAVASLGSVPPPPSVEQQVEALVGMHSTALVAPIVAATAASGAPAGCDLTVSLQAALNADPQVLAAARALPPAALTLANAYVLWNADWVQPSGPAAPGALDPIRTAVVDQVMAATPECRNQVQAGPRIVVIDAESTALTLVVGSGEWHWGDLLIARPGEHDFALENHTVAIR